MIFIERKYWILTFKVGLCFMDLFQSSDGYNLSSFSGKQKYIYKSKNKTICKATKRVRSKIQTYYLSKRFNMSRHFTI